MSRKKATTRYSLYAMFTDEKSIRLAEQERFGRVTPVYTLIYTAGKQPDGSREVSDEDLKRLSASDENWLVDCNLSLIMEETAKNEPAVIRRMEKIVNDFETELKKEAENANADSTDGKSE